VDKEGEKIKKIEGHGRRKGVKYGYELFFASWFVFADAPNFSDPSPRKCECHE
jgi:hypothetical protein